MTASPLSKHTKVSLAASPRSDERRPAYPVPNPNGPDATLSLRLRRPSIVMQVETKRARATWEQARTISGGAHGWL